ncbi:MAG TPA: hypothetical protein VL691_07920 [Vicinamibacteria bacterium]|nr:hypothetical protein [Vicinamibacteria bacterium]
MKGMAVVAFLLLTVVVAGAEGGTLPTPPSRNDRQRNFNLTPYPKGLKKSLPTAKSPSSIYSDHLFHLTHGTRAQ